MIYVIAGVISHTRLLSALSPPERGLVRIARGSGVDGTVRDVSKEEECSAKKNYDPVRSRSSILFVKSPRNRSPVLLLVLGTSNLGYSLSGTTRRRGRNVEPDTNDGGGVHS